MDAVHEWECPRCKAKLVHPYKCACGLRRAGWLTGLLEYRYPVGHGEAVVKDGRTTLTPATLCPVVSDVPGMIRGCEACEWEGFHYGPAVVFETARFDLT